MNPVQLIVENKVIELCLAGLLLAVLFIVVERFLTLVVFADKRILNRALAEAVRKSAGDSAKIGELSQDGACLLASILRRAAAGAPPRTIDAQMETALYRLNRPSGILLLIACVAPLVGLLGTVLGVITAFQLSDAQIGVASALTTTAGGIMVAVPAHIAAYFCEHRGLALMAQIQDILGRLTGSK